MKLLRSKYFIAFLIAGIVMVAYQMFRIYRADQAGKILGMVEYEFDSDPLFDPMDAEQWDGYETGSGVPPGK